MASIANLAVVLSANTAPFVAGLQTASKAVSRFGASVNSVASQIVSIGTAATAALVSLSAGAAVAWGVTQAAQAEQATTALGALIGDVEAAKQLYEDMQTLGREGSPFSNDAMTRAATEMLNFGANVKDVIPTIKALQDAGALFPQMADENLASWVAVMNRMRQTGEVTIKDLKAFANSNIPVWKQLAEKVGKSIAETKEMVERGEVGAGIAVESILEGINKRAGGLAAKQAQTLIGQWGRIKNTVADTLEGLAGSIIKAFNVSGGMDALLKWFDSVRLNADGIADDIISFGKSALAFGKDIAGAVGVVWDVLKAGGSRIASLFESFDGIGRLGFTSLKDTALDSLEIIGTAVAALGSAFKFVFDSIPAWFDNAKFELMKGAAEIAKRQQQLIADFSFGNTKKMAENNVKLMNIAIAVAEAERKKVAMPDIAEMGKAEIQKVRDFFKDIRRGGQIHDAGMLAAKEFWAGFGDVVKAGNPAIAQNLAQGFNMRPVVAEIEKANESLKEQISLIGQNKDAAQLLQMWKKGANVEELGFLAKRQDQLAGLQRTEAMQSPLEKYQKELKQIERELAAGGLKWNDYAKAVAKATEELISQSHFEMKSPEAVLAGSREAYSIAVQQMQASSPEKRIADALDFQKRLQQQLLENAKLQLKALQELGFPVVAKI